MSQASVFLGCWLITGGIQLCGWAVAYALQTEKFYDILGGLNFLAVAAFSAASADGWEADPRKVAATVIFACSRSWLLLFLAWRAHERGGDARFDGVKEKPFRFLVFWCMQAPCLGTARMHHGHAKTCRRHAGPAHVMCAHSTRLPNRVLLPCTACALHVHCMCTACARHVLLPCRACG